jgi:hypothetical protein
MRLMFVYHAYGEQGSGPVIQGYTRAARALGHEVCVYGRNDRRIPLKYSLNVSAVDAIVFIFEWTALHHHADPLDLLRLVSKVPRRRRVILDGDGNYNDPINVNGDYNHRDPESSRRWTEICDTIADKICQPTLHPLRPNVHPFLFYAYDPAWEAPLLSDSKDYDMLYVGHCKWRWQPMLRVLRAVKAARSRVGRIGLVGHGWKALPEWAVPMNMEDAYYSDPSFLNELGAEVLPPVPFTEVIPWMSRAAFNPVLLRPTFDRLRLVTPRMFETPAANTIPLFAIDREHAREIYGEAVEPLLLGDEGPQQVHDILSRPSHYREILQAIRLHLAGEHSNAVRLRRLIEIIES